MRKDSGGGGGVAGKRKGAAVADFAVFNASLPLPAPTAIPSHTQKLFNLLCPMFWQIAVEISPFFLLTLLTLFLLLLLSYSASIHFVLTADRSFYTWQRLHNKRKK
jgi:hypothetical protein